MRPGSSRTTSPRPNSPSGDPNNKPPRIEIYHRNKKRHSRRHENDAELTLTSIFADKKTFRHNFEKLEKMKTKE